MIRRTISRDDEIYECFPDLVKLSSGTLVCVYRESEDHVPRNYTRIVARTSKDGGDTWSEKEVISETRGAVDRVPGWNCPRVSELGDGRIATICDSLLWPENGDLGRRSDVHIWWSEDGIEWEGGSRTGASGIVPDRLRETVDGELVFGTHDCSPETGRLRQLLWRSVDGVVWELASTIADEKDLDLCEGSIIADGEKMACIMRENSGVGLPGYRALSADSGSTWGEVLPTNLLGCHRPVAGWWGGEILVTYRCFAGGGMKNTLLMGALVDPGILFDPDSSGEGRIFPIDYDRNIRPDTGYSGWCGMPAGEVLVAYYIKDDAPVAQIRCAGFSRKDLEMVE